MKLQDREKTNILKKQFVSVFTEEPTNELPNFESRTETELPPLRITEEMVYKKLTQLDANKDCDSDEIHPRFLKELKDWLTKPITAILQKSLDEGRLPRDWITANVSPLFKKGSISKATNYRPISLTSIVCKKMESVIKDCIMDDMRHKDLLSNKQFGFINGRSTTIQLLNFLDKFVELMAKDLTVDTIYFDFFIKHLTLLRRLNAYDIKGKFLKWIEDFLTARIQTVQVNSTKSDPAIVTSGIPQGSVLGPILFLIYINDLPDNIKSDIYLFADDTKVFKKVSSKEEALELQQDIDILETWSQVWLLKFHPEKSKVLTLGKLENIQHAHRYTLNDYELEHVFDQNNLGVTIDSDLKFDVHIAKKIQKSNTMLGLIKRSFTYMDSNLFKTLYTSYVRPRLEYGSIIWSPFLMKNIKAIENIQRRATKLVATLKHLPYEDRLKRLDLPTLTFRRKKFDMIEMYKHFHHYDKCTLSESFLPRNRPSRQHDFQLVPKTPKDGVRGPQTNSFFYRASKTWNELPKTVTHANNIAAFKRELDNAWKNDPSRYNIQSDS